MSKKNKNPGKETLTLEKMPVNQSAMNSISGIPMVSGTDFDNAVGEALGKSGFLALDIGQAAGPFTLLPGFTVLNLDDGDVNTYSAADKAGNPWGLPISASFARLIEGEPKKKIKPELFPGDTFLVKREPDALKKKGKGKGKPMKIYRVKVISRAGK